MVANNNYNLPIMPPRPASKVQLLLLGALCLSVASFLVCQIHDYDVWWHVAIGRDIIAKCSVPIVDQYAAAALGRLYHDSHWMFQVVLAVADHFGGMIGVQLVMVALWGAILALTCSAICRWVDTDYALALVFLVAMASVERFLPRPELITFLGIAFFYRQLQLRKYHSKTDLFLLFLVQLIWVNGHGLFVIGPFLIGCYWLVTLSGLPEHRRSELPALSRGLGLVLLATLVTPYGIGNWQYAWLLFQEAGPNAPDFMKNVGELSSTFGDASRQGVAFWFYLPLIVLVVLSLCLSLWEKCRPNPARLIIVLGLFLASLTGRRNMVVFALVAAPFAAETATMLLACRRPMPNWLMILLAAAILAWTWFPLSGNYFLKADIPSRVGLGASPSYFSPELPRFLDRIGYRGQMFTSNYIGGFYLYHGYPTRIPFTDGRWEVYDFDVFKEISGAMSSPSDWWVFVKRKSINGVTLQHVTPEAGPLLPLLHNDRRWKLVYLDHAVSCWLPIDSEFATPGLVISQDMPLPKVGSLEDCLILDVFLQRISASELRARNLERALSFGRKTEWLLLNLGQTLLKLGRYDKALPVFERLNRDYPSNVVALNELAFFAYQRNDSESAKKFLEQALKIDPGNKEAQANYQRLRILEGPGSKPPGG